MSVSIALLTLGVACGSAGVGEASGDSGVMLSDTAGTSTGASADGTDDADGTDGEKLDVPISTDLPANDEECAAVSAAADLIPVPADIIFVVDNSGSMDFEATQIQAKLNDFSAQIIDSGIDTHVVLISSYPDNGNGICIDPPLGAGGCPDTDTNAPTFIHVDERVQSHNAWERLLETHDRWSEAIREESSTHIVVVTDDTSDMGREEFDAAFLLLDPSYAGYIHHSVVSHSECDDADGVGTRYIELSQQTMGVASDLCDQDFQAVFDVLSTEVIGGTELACEFEIPAPPDDMEFNPDQVNLEFDDGMGGILEIGRVEAMSECPNVTDGWYYDDPLDPQLIVVCPQSCQRMQGVIDGSINISFGCASMPAG